jgi:hypothetical protein
MKRDPIETLDNPHFEAIAKRLFSTLPPRVAGGRKENMPRLKALLENITKEFKKSPRKKR